MNIPKANYVVNEQGEKIFVQLSIEDWQKFIKEYKRIKKQQLKSIFKKSLLEITQIQTGNKKGTTLNDFLHEI
jgi:hypothetical protein